MELAQQLARDGGLTCPVLQSHLGSLWVLSGDGRDGLGRGVLRREGGGGGEAEGGRYEVHDCCK